MRRHLPECTRFGNWNSNASKTASAMVAKLGTMARDSDVSDNDDLDGTDCEGLGGPKNQRYFILENEDYVLRGLRASSTVKEKQFEPCQAIGYYSLESLKCR